MKKNSHLARLILVGIIFGLLAVILIWRMLDLMVLDRQFLKNQGDARSLRTVEIPAYRGMMTDRNGVPLAVSTRVQSVWVNPKTFQADPKQMASLCRFLHIPEKRLRLALKHYHDKEFLYLKRQLQPALVEKIEALKIPGLNFQQEYKRFYPQIDSTAQLVGFTNIDDQGIEGLELTYQDWLMGISGKKRVIKDRLGRVVDDLGLIKAQQPGHDLSLSIDSRIQYLAYHALVNTCHRFEADSGSVVVLDAKTGEILAVVNYPSFNPNARFRYTKKDYRNRAMVDLFEPGSVIKPFSIAAALETGLFTPDTVIDTRPSWMIVNGHTIRDVHNYGVLDVTGVLANSSNVGVSKMTLMSPPEQLLGLLKKVGFGERTESGFPGESDGSLVDLRQVNPFVLSTVSFGYGVSLTALQLARAYLIFANEGQQLGVTLLAGQETVKRGAVISPKTAKQVLLMMESVLEQGTGRSAKIRGYRVAGKTGTARIAGKNGYEEKRHIASFVGIAPVSDPRLVVVAVIHEPTKGGYYGSAVAGPLFSEVMQGALRILNIPPDKQETS